MVSYSVIAIERANDAEQRLASACHEELSPELIEIAGPAHGLVESVRESRTVRRREDRTNGVRSTTRQARKDGGKRRARGHGELRDAAEDVRDAREARILRPAGLLEHGQQAR